MHWNVNNAWTEIPNTNLVYGWNHYELVYNTDTNQKLVYINGKLSKSDATSGAIVLGDFKIGNATALNYYYQGKIDDFKIYNYARTPAQVAYDYNRGKPVAYYKLDECTGATVHSTNETYNAGLNGTVTIGGSGTQTSVGTCTTSSTAWGNGATGKVNSSLNFDGTDDHVSVPYNDAFKFGTGDFTLSWWANHTALSGLDTYYENGYYYAGILVRYQGEMGVYIQYATGADFYGFTWVPTLDRWYHLTLRRQSGKLSFYVDGVQVGTTRDSTQNIQPSTATFIGHSTHAGASQYFNGKLDEFQIYNYALSPEQIKTVYNNGAVSFK